jgi:hypothetical protein
VTDPDGNTVFSVSFDLNGVPHSFTSSDYVSERPYVVGFFDSGQGSAIYRYEVIGALSAQDVSSGTNYVRLVMTVDGDWYPSLTVRDASAQSIDFFLDPIPDAQLSTVFANIGTPGAAVTGNLPGPYTDLSQSYTLTDVRFTLERLPDVDEYGGAQ